MSTTTARMSVEAEFQALLDMPGPEQLRLLIEYAGSKNKQKVELAMQVLAGGGPPIVPLLIRQAFARGRRPTHAVNLLGIVGRIASPLDLDNWMRLFAGGTSSSKRVRARCTQLLLQLGHEVVATKFAAGQMGTPG